MNKYFTQDARTQARWTEACASAAASISHQRIANPQRSHRQCLGCSSPSPKGVLSCSPVDHWLHRQFRTIQQKSLLPLPQLVYATPFSLSPFLSSKQKFPLSLPEVPMFWHNLNYLLPESSYPEVKKRSFSKRYLLATQAHTSHGKR